MDIFYWLNKNAILVPFEPSFEDGCQIRMWVTRLRGDYITLEGMESKSSYLIDYGITENVSSIWAAGKPINIGFNPEQQKWYGWSHRAIFGFGVGSECKEGDCHYRPTDKDDFLNSIKRFWSDPGKQNITAEHRDSGVYVEWEYSNNIPNEKIRGSISGCLNSYPDSYGKGEWKAETLHDAMQMAIDFADAVS